MRVFQYGALAPTMNADQVSEQMHRAHRYYNALVEAERKRRDDREASLKQEPDYLAACAAVAKAEGDVRDADDDQRSVAKARLSQAWEDHKKARKAAMKTREAEVQQIKTAWYAVQRKLRAECGCYWGTYLVVEDAIKRAIQTGREPKFRRFDGSGTIAVQIQKGMSVSDLLGCEDNRVRLRIVNDRVRVTKAELSIRVRSEGRDPVWATFPVRLHRPLPGDARIKWVRVHRRRIGTDTKWSVQFVIDTHGEVRPMTRGTVALDVGWRSLPDGDLRVAVWRDDAGKTGELRIPKRLLDRLRKTQDLREIRDRMFNDAVAAFRERDTKHDPDWLAEATETIHQWRSAARLAALALRWRSEWETDNRLDQAPGKAPLALVALEAWRKRDKHLYTWESHQRENTLLARREIYRLFAIEISRYRRVILEKFDLRKPAQEAKDLPPNAARFIAAISTLRTEIKNQATKSGAVVVEVDARHTTTRCVACGTEEGISKSAAASGVWVTCSQCGARKDQDYSACANLLALDSGEWTPGPPKKTRKKRTARKGSGKRAA